VATIGRFGKARPKVEDLDFDYFDIKVRVNPDASEALLFRLMDEAEHVDINSTAAIPVLTGFLRGFIHPEDWETFLATAVRERQDAEDLLSIIGGITEALADRPTQQSSGSAGGLSTTPNTSTEELSSLDIQHRYEQAGRPDLALVVQEVRERKAAAS
jgi:hypothetical protein